MTGKKPTFDITDAPAPRTEKFSAPETGDQKAIALRYAHGRDNAPILSAKGEGSVAEQILQVAFANGIRVRKDTDLTEILMAVEVESEIPLEAFAAVAEILNYIYRINRIYGDSSRSQSEPKDEIAAAHSGDRNGEGKS